MPSLRVLVVHDPIESRGLLEALSVREPGSFFQSSFESVSPAEAVLRVGDGFDAIVVTCDCPYDEFAELLAATAEQTPEPGIIVLVGPATAQEIRVNLVDVGRRRLHAPATTTPLALTWTAAGIDAPDTGTGAVKLHTNWRQDPCETRNGPTPSHCSARWDGNPKISRARAMR
jgi:hypothetical protein